MDVFTKTVLILIFYPKISNLAIQTDLGLYVNSIIVLNVNFAISFLLEPHKALLAVSESLNSKLLRQICTIYYRVRI